MLMGPKNPNSRTRRIYPSFYNFEGAKTKKENLEDGGGGGGMLTYLHYSSDRWIFTVLTMNTGAPTTNKKVNKAIHVHQ